jgi:hypothetical protein
MKVFAVVAAVAAFALSAHAATTRPARVTVTDLSPFTVHGSHFVAHERVTVTVMIKSRHVHRVSASGAGTFTTVFTGVSLDRCIGYAVRATGDSGSTAFLKVVPECPPPDEPPVLYPTDQIPKKR